MSFQSSIDDKSVNLQNTIMQVWHTTLLIQRPDDSLEFWTIGFVSNHAVFFKLTWYSVLAREQNLKRFPALVLLHHHLIQISLFFLTLNIYFTKYIQSSWIIQRRATQMHLTLVHSQSILCPATKVKPYVLCICDALYRLWSCNNTFHYNLCMFLHFPNPSLDLEIFPQILQEWPMLLAMWFASMWVFMCEMLSSFPQTLQAYTNCVLLPTVIFFLSLSS